MIPTIIVMKHIFYGPDLSNDAIEVTQTNTGATGSSTPLAALLRGPDGESTIVTALIHRNYRQQVGTGKARLAELFALKPA